MFWPVEAAHDRGGSRPELACPCPVVKVGPRHPASQETCVEPRGRLRQSPCGWRRAAVPDGGVKPRENRPVSTTSSSPGRAEDAPTAWHEVAPTWFLRHGRHVCDRPRVRSGRYRETVRSETAMPSFGNSPWMRGAPQRQFSVRMRRMRSRTADSMRGLPGRRRERALHHPGNPRRCHRATVAGSG